MNRGDVVLVDFPYTSGLQSKVRPAVVVQNDRDNQRLSKTIVAMVTGNVRRAGEPTHLLLDPSLPEHAALGLHAKSLVVCVNLFTIEQTSVVRTIGQLSGTLFDQLNDCLRAALALA
ncbi:MAG TPA: type II toxin-antitoxin system PemK/MazF family toxin [Pirellulales bacterium]|nr:type II toxin-antitoxin system PemK/MazF family toxin [Pirellulales bacterium]